MGLARARRHVSEVVAEVVLILVTLSVGSFVLYYVYSQTSLVASQRVNAQDYLGYVVPVTASVSNGTLYMVVDTGPMGADIEEVISNAGALSCSFIANTSAGQTLTGSLPFNAPAYAVVEIICGNVPNSVNSVTLATNVGEVNLYVG